MTKRHQRKKANQIGQGIRTDLKMTLDKLEKICVLLSMQLLLLKEGISSLFDGFYLKSLWEHLILLDIHKPLSFPLKTNGDCYLFFV